MKTNLADLTVAEFTDLVCGDLSGLKGKGEVALPPKKAAETMREIVMEYKTIADPGGAKSYLLRSDDLLKARMGIILYGICKNAVAVNAYDLAREILAENGVRVGKMSDKRLDAEVSSRLEKAKKALRDLQEEGAVGDSSPGQIRANMDGQTASLMAHFKFQIDPATMRANVYAHLVARHNREIKAQIAAMKKQ